MAQAQMGEVQDGANVVVAKQKITLSKDASKKKIRIEVVQSNHHSSQVAVTAGEEDENGYVSNLVLIKCALMMAAHRQC